MIQIWALRYRQSGSDRLEKQPTDLRQSTCYFGDRTLAPILAKKTGCPFYDVIRTLFFALSALAMATSGYAQAPATPANPAPSPLTTPAPPQGKPGPAGQPVADQDTVTRLQIFLDEHSFGPGKIDGRWGEFIGKALQRFQAAHGQQPSGQIDSAVQQELQKISPVYTTYTLTASDRHWVGKVPSSPAGMAKLKRVLYRSALDYVAERYHADPEFIRKLNSGRSLNELKKGTRVQVPNVQPFQIESIRAVPDLPPKPEFAQRIIRVDTKGRMLDLVDANRVIASFPITPGSKSLPAPIGTWKVEKVTTMPIFRWDEAMLKHGRRSSHFYTIPPGPRNPVGIVWIGLNKKGVGIHGTDSPDTIGRSASHGCIRLANWDAARLVNQVTVGMRVEIY
ncbi:MAG TPA: L,D-transpeptidase family protein [Chthoniobacterales bacterium]